MGGGFELYRESFEGSVKRYRNSRLEVTVRDYDDYDGSWDPEQVVITAKTIKFSGMKYAIAPTASGLFISGSSGLSTYSLSLRAIDRLTDELKVLKQDLLDIEDLIRDLFPGVTVADR